MEILQWIRFIIAALFIACGIIVEIMAIVGVYRFKYVLNRMHCSAMGDTLGLDMVLIGIIIISGFTYTSLKLLITIIVFMFTSPVSSHLIAKMEIETNKDFEKECEVKRQ